MNDLKIFTYGETPVRTVQKNEEVWWVLADVCGVLELKNPTMIANRLDDDERAKFDLGRQGSGWIINEPGLYSVILRSDKPEARRFKRWVVHEVLPQIRKTGSYDKQDDKLKVAKLIASCTSEAAVNGILALYGVPTIERHLTPGVEKNAPDSVVEYLKTVETWELTNSPQKHVYQDYISFCEDKEFLPVSLTWFSRSLHRIENLVVRRHRVNGELTGFYT